MANERAFLRQEIKRLKTRLKTDVEEFVADTSGDRGEAVILLIDSILNLQRRLNATYKPMDERTIIERASKRVAKSAAAAKGAK